MKQIKRLEWNGYVAIGARGHTRYVDSQVSCVCVFLRSDLGSLYGAGGRPTLCALWAMSTVPDFVWSNNFEVLNPPRY